MDTLQLPALLTCDLLGTNCGTFNICAQQVSKITTVLTVVPVAGAWMTRLPCKHGDTEDQPPYL